jgi:hypothetical protein
MITPLRQIKTFLHWKLLKQLDLYPWSFCSIRLCPKENARNARAQHARDKIKVGSLITKIKSIYNLWVVSRVGHLWVNPKLALDRINNLRFKLGNFTTITMKWWWIRNNHTDHDLFGNNAQNWKFGPNGFGLSQILQICGCPWRNCTFLSFDYLKFSFQIVISVINKLLMCLFKWWLSSLRRESRGCG